MTFGRDFDRLRNEMEELFVELWNAPRRAGPRRSFRPEVDVYRTSDPPAVTVVVDLAGVDPADVKLAFADGVLTIAGVRRRPAVSQAVYQQIELDYGSFERRIPIGDDVDSGAAQATYGRGLLTVTLPLAERPSTPVRVPINVKGQS